MKKVLVANRGEIALRVFRAARELGLGTVAVVAPDDPARCMRARPTRPSRSRRTSTPPEHIRAARETGADASTPATASSPRTATSPRRSQAAGLTWVGPPPDALRARRRQARRRSASPREAGVPTVPEADEPPLIVKAAAGGGGRGMRIVRSRGRARRRARRGAARGAGGVRRRPRLPRALPRAAAARRDPAARRRARHRARARRARVLGAAPPPEGARGVAVDRRSTPTCARR